MRNAILSLLASLPIVIGTAQADVQQFDICNWRGWQNYGSQKPIQDAERLGFSAPAPIEFSALIYDLSKKSCSYDPRKYLYTSGRMMSVCPKTS